MRPAQQNCTGLMDSFKGAGHLFEIELIEN